MMNGFVQRARRSLSSALIGRILQVLVAVVIVVVLADAWQGFHADSIGKDASQNLRYAINLSQHGVYSESIQGLRPGFRREPFPNWTLAAYLHWFLQIPKAADIRELIANSNFLTQATRINFLYFLALLLSLWGLCLRLIRPGWLANAVAIGIVLLSSHSFAAHELTNLNTELPAALLLVLTSLAFVLLRQTSQRRWALLAGLAYGCLALTKSSGAYLALLVLPMLALLLHRSCRQPLKLSACLALGFAVAVLPWVGRNLIQFRTPAIAEGSGDVLLFRSSYNQMTPKELRGAFYAYAPQPLQDTLFGPIMGLSQRDLECGGSLQRLQRSLPCDKQALADGRVGDIKSFYLSAKPLLRDLNQQGRRGDQPLSPDRLVRQYALQKIKSDPARHLAVSFPLAWRGLWSFRDKNVWTGAILNASAMVSLLLMPWIGLARRKPDWILVSILGCGYFLFYALFSHFIPRYSEPLIPLSLVCLSLLLLAAIRGLLRRMSANRVPGPQP